METTNPAGTPIGATGTATGQVERFPGAHHGRSGYLVLTAVLAGGAWGAVLAAPVPEPGAVGVGLAAAWAVQAAAFWPLAGALARGERAVGIWVAGIAARIAGFGGLWMLTMLAAMAGGPFAPSAGPLLAAYGIGIAGLLVLEAAWLGLRRRRQQDRAG